MKIHLSIVFVLLVLSGCKAGSGEGLDEQGRPLDEAPILLPPEELPPEGLPPEESPPVDDGIKATLASRVTKWTEYLLLNHSR